MLRADPLSPAALFPFPLDRFQEEAIEHLRDGRSVLVCAPTGSGKTVIAEFAIHLARARRRRVFYTTPLKALSNQKFRDLTGSLGAGQVGLLTGDISINREAPVVVMTTEVFRNMLYGTTLGAVEANLREVDFVVLDEVHYMNDADRGTVWEESIIYCPPALQIVALSATVANAAEVADWMSEVHGPTALVSTDFRPVPLCFHYYDGRSLTQLKRFKRIEDTRPRLDRQTSRTIRRGDLQPEPDALVQELASRDLLPAIYFVFSRRGCDAALLTAGRLCLLTDDEEHRVEVFVDRYLEDYPSVADHPHLPYLFRGLAVHHAGMLPTWKVLVERLFQAGLVKCVFATETLAAGINMPARTTVLSSITKRGDAGHRTLTASEFLQMSGRAGRRGMDEVGHVVVVGSPFTTIADAQRLAAAPPDPLGSRFTPSYGMVLNLLQRHSLEEAEFLISRSFGEYQERKKREAMLARRRKRTLGGGARFLPPTTAASAAGNWQRFLCLKAVLHHYGFLEDDRVTPAGVTAASFRAEHELLVALTVLSGELDGLAPAEFAAAVTALVGEDLRPTAWVKARPNRAVMQALQQIAGLARQVRVIQLRHRLTLPTRVQSDCAGLTQLWAEGADWEDLMRWTNLDEGDVVRVLRRTADLVQQIAHAPLLGEDLTSLAREAASLLDREPVREIL